MIRFKYDHLLFNLLHTCLVFKCYATTITHIYIMLYNNYELYIIIIVNFCFHFLYYILKTYIVHIHFIWILYKYALKLHWGGGFLGRFYVCMCVYGCSIKGTLMMVDESIWIYGVCCFVCYALLLALGKELYAYYERQCMVDTCIYVRIEYATCKHNFKCL